MWRAALYGLIVESHSPLGTTQLPPSPQGSSPPDLELLTGTGRDFAKAQAVAAARAPKTSSWFHYIPLPDGGDYLRWPNVCECLIAPDGRRVISRALDGVAVDTLQTYLLSQVLSFALLKQGIESLHATTVVLEGGAVGFLGDCGAGKSTLAAGCLKAGAGFLTDDVLILKPAGKQTLAYPGPARLKLMPHVARRVLGPEADGAAMNPFTAKRVIPVPSSRAMSKPVPLRALYVLHAQHPRRVSRTAIRRLPVQEGWHALTAATFNPLVREPTRLRRQFSWSCELALRVPVKTLTYPRTLHALPHVVEALVADLDS